MTIIYTKQTQNDFLELKMFVTNGASSAKASEIVKMIKAKVQELEIFPKRHKVWKDSKYRYFLVKNFVVFYRIDEANEKILLRE